MDMIGQTQTKEREYLIRELVKPNDPILREKLPRFDFRNPPMDPVELAYTLCDTMIHNNGQGLAANQIGLPYRVFAIKSNPMLVCFNPVIVDTSQRKAKMEEGCLSYPGLIVKVERPDGIKVRYAEPTGVVVTKKFIGMTSRIFQHELDHLNGVIMTDHIGKVSLDMALEKARKRGFNFMKSDFRKPE